VSATEWFATAASDCWLAPSIDRGAHADQGTRAEFPARARPALANSALQSLASARPGSGSDRTFGREFERCKVHSGPAVARQCATSWMCPAGSHSVGCGALGLGVAPVDQLERGADIDERCVDPVVHGRILVRPQLEGRRGLRA
jgi:hypothetical protein